MNLKTTTENKTESTNDIYESYFIIHRFMTEELGLGGAKLLVYALIYSFTVSEGSFFGSRGYMAEACGASVKTIDRTLRELVKCGLLIKGEATHLESIEYKANISPQTEGESQNDAPSKMSHSESQNVSTPASKCLSGGVKMTHNNKDYNKTNIHTSIHTISAYANAEEDTEEVDRFAEGNTKKVSRFAEEDTGAKASLEKDRVIGEKNSFRHGSAVPPPSKMEAKDRFAEGNTKEGNKNEGENSFHRKRSPSPKEEALDRRRMSPSLEDGGCEVRIIHEGKNKDKEVEKLKREIDEGTFRGDIKVPGDIFLEDELIQRKHGLIDAKRNKDDDLRCVFSRFGDQQTVQMTDAQYDYLARTYGEDTVEEYIQRLEHTILTKPGFRAYSHYKTIIRWLKEDMQCADAFAPV